MSQASILALISAILKLAPELIAALEGIHAAVSAKSAPVSPVAPDVSSSSPAP